MTLRGEYGGDSVEDTARHDERLAQDRRIRAIGIGLPPDTPCCDTCERVMQPTGACHTCPGCGDTTGCG